MFSDRTNYSDTLSAPSSSSLVASTNSDGKRPFAPEDGTFLPSKLKAKRRLGSSSSPDRSSSPFAFGNTRLDAYNAPSSPFLLSTLSTSPCKPLLAPSSPSASFLPSSPTATKSLVLDFPTAEDALTLRLERGNVLQFGRKGKKVQPNHRAGETTLPILLPRSAKNASRLHCTVRILPSEGSRIIVEVRVLGQNGMKVDGILWPAGSVAVLTRPAGATLELSFWGWTSFVIVAESEKVEKKKVVKVVSRFIPIAVVRSPSPAPSFNSLFDDSLSSDEVAVARTLSTPLYSDPPSLPTSSSAIETTSPRRASSPALSALSALSSSPVREKSPSSTSSRATTLVSSLGLDLAGLIASAIVFHPRSTVGVEEVVKALLNEVGGMWSILDGGKGEGAQREEAAVEAWWDVVESVMQEEAFFGCIENVGLRDAAGNELPPAYYYRPDDDPSASRVEALEPFVKRVRGARTAGGGKRYFWRRPCLKKNR